MDKKRFVLTDAHIESLSGRIVYLEAIRIKGLPPRLPKAYYGKIGKYDEKLITLNPFFEARDYMAFMITPVSSLERDLQGLPEGLEDHMKATANSFKLLIEWMYGRPAGSTSKQIVIKRNNIVRLHDYGYNGQFGVTFQRSSFLE